MSRDELIALVRSTRDQRSVQRFELLLEACVTEWTEQLIRSTGETASEHRGAVLHVRDLLADLRTDIESDRIDADGAYTN